MLTTASEESNREECNDGEGGEEGSKAQVAEESHHCKQQRETFQEEQSRIQKHHKLSREEEPRSLKL